MDAGILFEQESKQAYFTEYCPSRKGYNSFLTELSMLPSTSHYFECLKAGMNPFKTKLIPYSEDPKKFGASIRLFNFERDKNRFCMGEIPIIIKGKDVWLWDVKMKDSRLITVGQAKDVACATGAGDSPEEAIQNAQKNVKDIIFKDLYYRDDIAEKSSWFNLLYRYYWLKDNKFL